jgi:hypothetical protein
MKHDELFKYPELLLTKPLRTQAQVRTYIGYVAELFVCRALGGERLSSGSEEVVPDMRVWNCTGEIKSVGKNNRALIYKWRLEKELRLLDLNRHLYVFCCHRIPITLGNVKEIVERFNEDTHLVITTLGELSSILLPKKVRKFNLFTPPEGMPENAIKRRGYNREGYIDGGWQFSIRELTTVAAKNLTFDWAGRNVTVLVEFTHETLATST